jgi:hypothetical protein
LLSVEVLKAMEIVTRSTQKKRKSGEDELHDSENTSPNLSPIPGKLDDTTARKLRFKTAAAAECAEVIVPVTKAAKSGLARYQKAPLSVKVAAAVTATEVKRAALSAQHAATTSTATATTSTAELVPVCAPVPPKTPTRSQGLSAQTPKSAAKRGNTSSLAVVGSDVVIAPADNVVLKRLAIIVNGSYKMVSHELDTAFSVNEDKISTIMQALRAKVKGGSWDFKEKVKKQETVIKELKDALSTTLQEIRPLKDLCSAKEGEIETLLRDAHSELHTALASAVLYRSLESKCKSDLETTTEELSRVSKALRKLSEEHGPLKKSEALLQTQCTEHTQRLQSLEEAKTHSEIIISTLQTELRLLKESSTKAAEMIQAQYEQRIEQQQQLHSNDVSNLRSELNRRSSEVERSMNDRVDWDKKYSEVREQLLCAQSSVREAESALNRVEQEKQRLTNDLDLSRSQLAQKDADLRQTLTSLQDIQKQGMEEKYSIRAELRFVE